MYNSGRKRQNSDLGDRIALAVRGSVYCRSKRARLKKNMCYRCATLAFEVDLAIDSRNK
jgi:hypothetical protein